jgi:hypothetical protein
LRKWIRCLLARCSSTSGSSASFRKSLAISSIRAPLPPASTQCSSPHSRTWCSVSSLDCISWTPRTNSPFSRSLWSFANASSQWCIICSYWSILEIWWTFLLVIDSEWLTLLDCIIVPLEFLGVVFDFTLFNFGDDLIQLLFVDWTLHAVYLT